MLKKRERLSRRQFEELLKHGRRLHSDHLSVVYRRATHDGGATHANDARCGVVVSKKVARHATARNLLRRRVYAVLGEQLPALRGLHLAVLTRPTAARLAPATLREELSTLVSEASTKGRAAR